MNRAQKGRLPGACVTQAVTKPRKAMPSAVAIEPKRHRSTGRAAISDQTRLRHQKTFREATEDAADRGGAAQARREAQAR